MVSSRFIRNFSIIAHIDHGKSTLADRVIEITHGISERKMTSQVLDKMDIERERGITIKAQPISLQYQSDDGNVYQLNLIDTPGHVDFSYEVSRSLAACEGALLLVDATQGLEAQTFSHMYLAFDQNLEIIPVLNKMDLPTARPEESYKELKAAFAFEKEEVYAISAKTGENVHELLEAIIKKIPPPPDSESDITRALIFDADFNMFRGVILHVRVFDGSITKGEKLILNFSGKQYEVSEVGTFQEEMAPCERLDTGEVGYVIAGIKNIKDVSIGDTVFKSGKPGEPLKGFEHVKPMVYAGIYPTDNEDYEKLKVSLGKMTLNDSSLEYKPETSPSLGFGFRAGFLGMLHMEIVAERLRRHFDSEVIFTSPSVVYRVIMKNSEILEIHGAETYPDPVKIDHIQEPIVNATIVSTINYVDPLIRVIEEKRGKLSKDIEYLGDDRIILHFDIPLSELITNFFDRMKSVTRGYSSLDYSNIHYRTSNIVKVDIKMNEKSVPAFSFLAERSCAESRGRAIIKKLKGEIPRHMFVIKLQAAIGGKIVAGEKISAMRKDVTAKCYGGDITRKRKLLEKQKAGKKKMRAIGNINVPKEAFINVLKVD